MQKKLIDNHCQFCDHSAKEYLCIKDKFTLIKASFCMKIDMTKRERKSRLHNKVVCEHFKPARVVQEELLTDINYMLDAITAKLDEIKETLMDEYGQPTNNKLTTNNKR